MSTEAYTRRALITEYRELLQVYTLSALDHDNGGQVTANLILHLTNLVVTSLQKEDVTTVERRVEALRRLMVAQFPDSQYMRDIAAGIY